jgi:hypothetical protein
MDTSVLKMDTMTPKRNDSFNKIPSSSSSAVALSSSSSTSISSKEIVNDTWEIKKKVGKGSFCELFVAKNILTPLLSSSSSSSSSISSSQYYAIKIQNDDIDSSVLRAEGIIIIKINNYNYIIFPLLQLQ